MALACQAAKQLAPAAAAAVAASSSRRLPVLCRAASSRASKAAQPDVSYHFERAAGEAPAFPELFQPGRRAVLLAVDPDLHGAVAALSWRNPPAPAAADGYMPSGEAASGSTNLDASGSDSSSSSSSSSVQAAAQQPHQQQQHLSPTVLGADQLRVEVHDMPLEVWDHGSRSKRQPEASGLIRILQRYQQPWAAAGPSCGGNAGGAGSGGSDSGGSTTDGSSRRKKRGGRKAKEAEAAAVAEAGAAAADPIPATQQEPAGQAARGEQSAQQGGQQAQQQAAHEEEPPVVRALVEYSMPAQLSGKYAWYGIGFSVGLLNGLLAAQGIVYHRVHAATWKTQMGLRKQGKDGSIALARHLLPAAADMLKRKKDHGRAEALLLAAWGLGVRMQPLGTSGMAPAAGGDAAAAGGDAAADDEAADASGNEEGAAEGR